METFKRRLCYGALRRYLGMDVNVDMATTNACRSLRLDTYVGLDAHRSAFMQLANSKESEIDDVLTRIKVRFFVLLRILIPFLTILMQGKPSLEQLIKFAEEGEKLALRKVYTDDLEKYINGYIVDSYIFEFVFFSQYSVTNVHISDAA
jgi:hypothetical protein